MSDPDTQEENGTVYYVLCKTQYACHDLDEFIHCWRQLHDAEEMYIDQCTSEIGYRSMVGETSELTRLAAENARLREACRAAMLACQDNLKMHAYKNEQVLLEAFDACKAVLAPESESHHETTESE